MKTSAFFGTLRQKMPIVAGHSTRSKLLHSVQNKKRLRNDLTDHSEGVFGYYQQFTRQEIKKKPTKDR